MVEYLANYQKSIPQNCSISSKERSKSSESSSVVNFPKESKKKLEARANLLKAAQKIHW